MRSKILIWVSIMVALAGCTGGQEKAADPKKRLNEYISRSFSVKSVQEREELMGYLTGQAKTRLAAWSEDQFRQAFMDSKRTFVRLAFTEVKSRGPAEVDIGYELSYIDQARGLDAKVTNKKLCQMVQENGRWYIRDVRNIKELVEYKEGMDISLTP